MSAPVITVQGAAEVIKALQAMPGRMCNKVVRPAVKAGVQPMKTAAVAFAPVLRANRRRGRRNDYRVLPARKSYKAKVNRPGLLRRSIKAMPPKIKRGMVSAQVGFKNVDELTSISAGGEHYFIPSAVEHGHVSPHTHSGHERKHTAITVEHKSTPAHPFMRLAFDATKRLAESTVAREVRANLAKAVTP